jgi:1-acyl-sn-glycerol-3-phosphate acyltransferase
VTALVYGVSKLLSWLFLRIGFGLEVEGQEHVPAQGAFVVGSNHVSYLDPLVVGVACPRRLVFMARHNLFDKPFLGWWLRNVGAIPVRREESDLSAVRAAVHTLRGGMPMAMFPEGTRQEDGRLSAAKRGVGLLAANAGVPIVPVYLQGTFDAMPRGGGVRPAKIRVAFGRPVTYTDAPVPSGSAPGSPPAPGQPVEPAARLQHQQLADAVTREWHALAGRLAAKKEARGR